jgi:hypothetical protein
MYKYLHDKTARTVYRFPSEPKVNEQMKRGKRIGWNITMEYLITRADNWLEDGSWKFATSANPSKPFDAHYTRDIAVSYFRRHYEPRGEAITIDEYERLHTEYEEEARLRRPNAQA